MKNDRETQRTVADIGRRGCYAMNAVLNVLVRDANAEVSDSEATSRMQTAPSRSHDSMIDERDRVNSEKRKHDRGTVLEGRCSKVDRVFNSLPSA